MKFQLEHDWQGNLATPRARIGEKAKTRLLILLCFIWLCMGLIGHEPWKQDEPQTISVVKSMLSEGNLIAPLAAGQTMLDHPPLYPLSAAGLAQLLSSLLPMHDAARLATGLWMALTLLLVGMAGRVQNLLLAGVERVRLGRNFDLDQRIFLAIGPFDGFFGADGRAGQEAEVGADVLKYNVAIFWVYAIFHDLSLNFSRFVRQVMTRQDGAKREIIGILQAGCKQSYLHDPTD